MSSGTLGGLMSMSENGNRPAAVEARGLVKTYDEVQAVRGVDLRVESGEVFGFLGPNGAGKSTTVRMLTTLLTITSGSATVAGVDVAADPDLVRRRIGVALQEAGLDPRQNGRELLILQARLFGMSPAEARRATLIESDGVEQVKERVRDVRAGNLLEAVLRDFRFGARMLVKNPAFTAAAVTMLAIGIGVNTAVFSVVNAVLLRGLPYSQPDRIVALYEMRPREHDLTLHAICGPPAGVKSGALAT